MSDQCKKCTFRGNIEECLKSECFHHENWFEKKLLEQLAVKDKEFADLKTSFDDYVHLINNTSFGHWKERAEKAEAELADLREKMKGIGYQDHQFCRNTNCSSFQNGICQSFLCHKSAKEFHKWLNENGFAIRQAAEGK